MKEIGVVAGAAATALSEFLDNRGIDGMALLREAGINPADLADRYAYISLQAMAKALELSAVTSDDPYFALHFTEVFEPSVSHACAYAIKNAPSLRDALQSLAEHRNTIADISTEFKDHGAAAQFCWNFNEEFDAPVQITDYTMMRTLYHIQSAAGKDWRPLGVSLTSEAPASDAEYRRFFGSNVRFNQPENCFAIETDLLDRPMPGADHDLYVIARRSFQSPLGLTEDEDSPLNRIRRFVGDRLERNNGTFKAAAKHVGMSTHQLRSYLKKHGTCFQCVVDETRKAVAEHYLLHTDHRFSEITFLLGFSDQSVFTRAVKRWFGVTPKQMRRAQ